MKYFMGLCLLIFALGSQANPIDVTTTVSPVELKSLNGKLAVAVFKDDVNEVRKLVQLGADVNFPTGAGSLLLLPSVLGRINMVKCLVDLGIDVNVGHGRETALWFATMNGRLEVVKYLVEHNADVNIGPYGTPLLEASFKSDLPIVKYLLEHNADVNVKDESGKTALDWALLHGHTEISHLLKNAGGKAVDQQDKYRKLFNENVPHL